MMRIADIEKQVGEKIDLMEKSFDGFLIKVGEVLDELKPYDTDKNDVVSEGKIKDEDSLKEYAMDLAKRAFGDKADEKIVNSIVQNAIKKSGGDWGIATGIVNSSFR
jgi:hypothetical protein